MKNLGQNANLLHVGGKLKRHNVGGCKVYFNADNLFLNIENLSNPEWIVGRMQLAAAAARLSTFRMALGNTLLTTVNMAKKIAGSMLMA